MKRKLEEMFTDVCEKMKLIEDADPIFHLLDINWITLFERKKVIIEILKMCK